MKSIDERLRCLIEVVTENKHRDKKLEERTGIGADTWKNFWFGRKSADGKMIECVSKAWPQYAFWLATGLDDEDYGHREPKSLEFKTLGYVVAAAENVFVLRLEAAQLEESGEDPKRAQEVDFALRDYEGLRQNQIKRRYDRERD